MCSSSRVATPHAHPHAAPPLDRAILFLLQGHAMVVSSRPAGIDFAQFSAFHRLQLGPLTDAQQRTVVVRHPASIQMGPLGGHSWVVTLAAAVI